jgi:hypothetical protein
MGKQRYTQEEATYLRNCQGKKTKEQMAEGLAKLGYNRTTDSIKYYCQSHKIKMRDDHPIFLQKLTMDHVGWLREAAPSRCRDDLYRDFKDKFSQGMSRNRFNDDCKLHKIPPFDKRASNKKAASRASIPWRPRLSSDIEAQWAKAMSRQERQEARA